MPDSVEKPGYHWHVSIVDETLGLMREGRYDFRSTAVQAVERSVKVLRGGSGSPP